jgi:hypothetical protein
MFHWCANADTVSNLVNVSTLPPFFGGQTPDTLPVTQVHAVNTVNYITSWKVNPADYTGRFTVYGLFLATASDIGEIYVTHGWSGSQESNAPVSFKGWYGSSWHLANLGQIHIPRGNQPIRGGQATIADYEVRIRTQKTSGNAFVAGICLVPVDKPAINTTISGVDYQTNIDGEVQRIYTTTYPSGDQAGRSTPFGQFLTLEPGKYNRFYILPDDGFTETAVVTLIKPTVDIASTLDYIPRYQTLR